MILWIDACPREDSRTRRLAKVLLERLDDEIEVVDLREAQIPVLDEVRLNKRMADCAAQNYTDDFYSYAKQFAAADTIVIAAPLWDLSFSASLKSYIEAITVSGITFRYSEQGFPIGLCKADRLYYVSTSGGPICTLDYGFNYIQAMATGMYGIGACQCFTAAGLDIVGNDPDAILQEAEERILRV